MKDQDNKFATKLQKLNDHHAKELKKHKEAWAISERAKRDRWEQEKVREIKEMTTKALEPDLLRLVRNHKLEIETLQQEHAQSLRRLKQEKLGEASRDLH